MEAVNKSKVTVDTVRERVRPLFYTRMRLGEFDPPEMNPYSKLSTADVETPEHKALAVEAAMKSFVLLKNNGMLPLNKTKFGTIGVPLDSIVTVAVYVNACSNKLYSFRKNL